MRFQAYLSAVFVLCVGSLACGQIKAPSEVTVQVGRLAAVPVSIDADDVQYSVLGGDAFDSFREFSSPTEIRLRVLGYANGVGYVVLSGIKGGKLLPLVTIKIIVGAGPGPLPPVPPVPPGPGPIPPVPPGPLDPLATAIRDAAKADGFTKLKDLAMGFRTCGALIDRASTVAELQASTAAALASAVPDMKGKAPRLRAILAKELDTLPETGALTPDIKARATAIFTTLAKSCEDAAR